MKKAMCMSLICVILLSLSHDHYNNSFKTNGFNKTSKNVITINPPKQVIIDGKVITITTVIDQ